MDFCSAVYEYSFVKNLELGNYSSRVLRSPRNVRITEIVINLFRQVDFISYLCLLLSC